MEGAGVNRLLDSVILIDHFNGIVQATRYLEAAWRESAISAITRAEVLTGFEEADWARARELLNLLPTLPIDGAVADEAARLRRLYRWKLPDALQAAVAQHHGLRLVTRNTRDFPPKKFSFVEMPYEL